MTLLTKYSKNIPHLYFISMITYWFINVNKQSGLIAYPILLLAIPFAWQILKPKRHNNFSLGIIFMCLSSYMVITYLSDALNIINLTENTKNFLLLSGLFVFTNLAMSLWIIKNSIKKVF